MSNQDGYEPEEGWPLLNDQPPMREWQLVAIMADKKKYRVTVTARSRNEACREIIHAQMAEGCNVLVIKDY